MSTDTPTRLISDMRGVRYGEVLTVSMGEAGLTAEVWGTQMLNDCPQELWETLDPAVIATEMGALFVKLNGPRHWMLDGLGTKVAVVEPVLREFNGLLTRRIATVDLGTEPSNIPYTERHVNRGAVFFFDAGKVDFSPERSLPPGDAPDFFPPKAASPGAVGDADYSPLVQFSNGKNAVFNMPMVAFDVSEDDLNAMCDGAVDYSRVHDKVVAICPRDGTVTLAMTLGYTFGKPIFYLSTEANDPTVATLEAAIHAPAMSDQPFALEDAAPGESAERIYVVVNGPTGLDNPYRQGINSAISDGGHGPLNILGGIPTINLDYSPIWRLFPVVWTADAIEKGYRTKVTNAIDIENAGAKGILESIAGGPPKAVGFLVNCPVVYRVN
jgi:hypothetical protein